MGRIVTIKGGKTRGRGVAHAKAGIKVDQRHHVSAKDWADTGVWVNVKSSWVQGIMYNAEEKELNVEFKSGIVCQYPNIQSATARGMFNASSLGKYVHRHLYDKPYVIATR